MTMLKGSLQAVCSICGILQRFLLLEYKTKSMYYALNVRCLDEDDCEALKKEINDNVAMISVSV